MSQETKAERMARRERIRAERHAAAGAQALARQTTKTERLMAAIKAASVKGKLTRFGLQ